MTTPTRVWTKRLFTWGLPMALIGALLVLALRPQPVPVDLTTVVRGDVRVTMSEEGQTRVRDRFVISAPVAGRLLRIELEPGDPVEADQTLLATFQPGTPALLDARGKAEAEAQVQAAAAALEQAKAEQARADSEQRHAEAELRRQTRLAEADVVSQDVLESATNHATTRTQAARSAAFAVQSARHQLTRARAALVAGSSATTATPIEIRSPVRGTVLQRLRESETVVPAGEPLIEIGDAAALEIVSDLLSTDAVRARPGQRVIIEHWGGDQPLEGVVRRVEPYGFTKVSALGVEEQRVNVIIDLVDDRSRWQSLGDGYRVEVRIVVQEQQAVLTVPTSSLFRSADGNWAVWAVAEGRATLRTVEIGARNGLEAEITAGLDEGEATIAHPSDAIAEGVQVEARED